MTTDGSIGCAARKHLAHRFLRDRRPAAAVGLALASWPERRRALTGGLVALIAGGILMIAGPGNADRASRFERPAGTGASMVGLDATEFLQAEALIAFMSLLLVFSVAAGAAPHETATTPLRRAAIAAAVIAVLWSVVVPLVVARMPSSSCALRPGSDVWIS